MAAKPFSDRVIPELSNIPLSDGESSFNASVTLECANPCRGQVNAVIDGETHQTIGFEITKGQSASVMMNGVFEAECLTIEVDCSETVLVTGKLTVEGEEPLKVRRFEQKSPVLVGRDPTLCEVDRCKTPAMAGRILCHKHAFPAEIVKSDRRRAIEATKRKKENAE